jgi:hypothetical protein
MNVLLTLVELTPIKANQLLGRLAKLLSTVLVNAILLVILNGCNVDEMKAERERNRTSLTEEEKARFASKIAPTGESVLKFDDRFLVFPNTPRKPPYTAHFGGKNAFFLWPNVPGDYVWSAATSVQLKDYNSGKFPGTHVETKLSMGLIIGRHYNDPTKSPVIPPVIDENRIQTRVFVERGLEQIMMKPEAHVRSDLWYQPANQALHVGGYAIPLLRCVEASPEPYPICSAAYLWRPGILVEIRIPREARFDWISIFTELVNEMTQVRELQ